MEELQYDAEGNPGKWAYSHRSNSPIFIREGETVEQAYIRIRVQKEEQEKLYQMRKSLEQAEESQHSYSFLEKSYKTKAQNTYTDLSTYLDKKPTLLKNLDTNNPDAVIDLARKLTKEHDNMLNSNAEVACFKSAGAVAAIFDKKGINSYRCFLGKCSEPKDIKITDVSNHIWVEYNGNVYETFPGHNRKDLTYHESNAEVFFYR